MPQGQGCSLACAERLQRLENTIINLSGLVAGQSDQFLDSEPFKAFGLSSLDPPVIDETTSGHGQEPWLADVNTAVPGDLTSGVNEGLGGEVLGHNL